ncbi:ROK family transcriptional regulator [Streptomyces sp. TRM70350]|uniref:ROK family transcriptional regulator n=1 Tax=Streptomyces sp. TRM70350 TaxID=2856165 RepID=UPI001C48659F|nr:ROK family transcriptional regulator [Streptomyces sp. TRM70350]MBV7699262.1 ROK family transcriptional regulator [Streptomyces sp. TRM70350]
MAGTAGTPGTPRVLRAMNDRAALDLLLEHGPLSRSRIGKLTGLSKPTASQLLARLEAAGLVLVTGTSEGRPGPNAQLYALNPAAAHAAGLDVTPERVLAAVADITGRTVGTYEVPAPGRRPFPKRSASPVQEGPSSPVVRQVTDALDGAVKAAGLARDDIRRLVIGTPGAFDPSTGRLRYASHLPGWHSPTLLDELAAALPMPVEYENDVNLVAVAEQRLGAARGHGDFVLLWNEGGLGAALVLGGRLHRGWTGGAGEVGFLPVPGAPLVRQVTQANSGGYQELAGSQAVPALARDLGVPDIPPGPYTEVAATLLARAAEAYDDSGRTTPRTAEDDPHRDLLHTYATRLATGLASLVSVLDPELVVLSGTSLTSGGETLRALVQAELAELAAARPRLVIGDVREHPVLRGALESALATTRDEVFDTSR